MSRVAGPVQTSDGTPRVAADINTVVSNLETASATIDSTNLAEEGLDTINLAAKVLVDVLETTGTRIASKSFGTATAFTGAGNNYRNEGVVPMVMGATSVELDWSGPPDATYTLAADEIMVIEAVLACGTSTSPAFTNGAAAGVCEASAIILIDNGGGGGYAAQTVSRSAMAADFFGMNVAGNAIDQDSFDLTPTYFVTSGSVKKIGVALGVANNVNKVINVNSVQLRARVEKKVR